MTSINPASLVNVIGFALGVALYGLLFVMVLRYRRAQAGFSPYWLLLLTAIFGLTWNLGEFSVYVWQDFLGTAVHPLIPAASYSALGFLPAFVVHTVWKNSEPSAGGLFGLTVSAYLLSASAALLHFYHLVTAASSPSETALWILSIGSVGLLFGLIAVNFRQSLEKKAVWVTTFMVFALSALHLTGGVEEKSWLIELTGHQASIPVAFAILYQDYRFAFADLFLKRAISLLLLSLAAIGLYFFAAAPLLAMHAGHQSGDLQTIGVTLGFGIVTALVYSPLHRFAEWIVDTIILRRADYGKLQVELAGALDEKESVESVLDESAARLKKAFYAGAADWREAPEDANYSKLPHVAHSNARTTLFLPTADVPHYEITLSELAGGRHLLSDDIKILETAAILTANRINNVRVIHERCEQEIKEQKFSKLTTEAELRALRSQINPHFLFNALTTIGYLINSAPEKALESLMKLTGLLRRVLTSNGEFSTLDEEMALITDYLEIEKVRFEDRLTVKIEVPEKLGSVKLPTLILQPVVENAIKHGVSRSKDNVVVRISASIGKNGGGDCLNLVVSNTDSGHRTAALDENLRIGVGLSNITQRLRSYYGEQAEFSIERVEGKTTRAEIKLPLNETLELRA